MYSRSAKGGEKGDPNRNPWLAKMVYFIITVNTYLFKYVPVKLDFIILSIIGVLPIPEEFYLYKDKVVVKVYQ
jgi:hypothetical protein